MSFHRSSGARHWPILAGFLASAMCMAAPPERESTRLQIGLSAADNVNPDEKMRPAPIEVSIYELKNPQAFEQADYFSLQRKDRTVLGPDLLRKESFLLRPGERRVIERKSDSEAEAIGVLAGYRELGQSVWRTVIRLKETPETAWYRALLPANKAQIDIRLDSHGIVLNENKK